MSKISIYQQCINFYQQGADISANCATRNISVLAVPARLDIYSEKYLGSGFFDLQVFINGKPEQGIFKIGELQSFFVSNDTVTIKVVKSFFGSGVSSNSVTLSVRFGDFYSLDYDGQGMVPRLKSRNTFAVIKDSENIFAWSTVAIFICIIAYKIIHKYYLI
jgi:hypothetical protein